MPLGVASRIMGSMLREPWLAALRLPLRTLPDPLHAFLLTRVLNRLLRRQPLAGRLGELDGRSISLHIRDTQTRLCFRIAGEQLVPITAGATQVTISGELADFLALATRAEDPDTLFFQRRLCIEGDVETGLHIKNLLDTVDFDWKSRLRGWLPTPAANTAIRLVQRVRTMATPRR